MKLFKEGIKFNSYKKLARVSLKSNYLLAIIAGLLSFAFLWLQLFLSYGFSRILFLGIFNYIFIINPLKVGSKRFFILLCQNQKPNLYKCLLFPFKKNHYFNIMWIMLLRDIKILFSYLLVIVPGIMAQYEYRPVPYILALSPKKSDEVFLQCEEEMKGMKKFFFKLDFSFILYYGLGLLTLGLSHIFFMPYYHATTCNALMDHSLIPDIEIKEDRRHPKKKLNPLLYGFTFVIIFILGNGMNVVAIKPSVEDIVLRHQIKAIIEENETIKDFFGQDFQLIRLNKIEDRIDDSRPHFYGLEDTYIITVRIKGNVYDLEWLEVAYGHHFASKRHVIKIIP